MNTQMVKEHVYNRLRYIQALPDNQRRGVLANLRKGVGHVPGELPELWGAFLTDMPDEFRGMSKPSHEEWAVYIALTYYAMHQQGNEAAMNCKGYTLGKAVRELAARNVTDGQDWTESSILRRFNMLVTANDIKELSYHLRGMIQLLSSAKGGGIPLDYPQLAADLYGLQCDVPGYEDIAAGVRLRWGQDLYRYKKSETDTKSEEI